MGSGPVQVGDSQIGSWTRGAGKCMLCSERGVHHRQELISSPSSLMPRDYAELS